MFTSKLQISITIILAIILLIQATGSILLAQSMNDRANIVKQTNVNALKEISKKASDYYNNNFNASMRISGLLQTRNSQNKIGYLSGFDKSGAPVYDYEDNIDVARTNGVIKIWDGGSSGLDLDGSGIEIGHWEAGGLASTTHQELRGRIKHAESESISSHATHTAGTMIGEGIVNSARGMAMGAKIISRRSNNDEAELADFAISGGILSNHSYSTGDPDGDTPLYGQYSENSREWDEILYNAPYLFVSKSAGNNRNDGVNVDDGGYDIIFTVAASKNLLTIGGVYDVSKYNGPESVDQSEFSNWGPTDDWRIKPDIVTSGVSVRSADNSNNASYQSKDGTSMSAAATTGTIALLQQHYHNLNDVYMKSATVKALLICTTDEVGSDDGPDFQSGWGLLNAERAAKVISNNGESSLINELSLSQGESYVTNIIVDGSSPLSLAIAWTDPPGTPGSGYDNQTPILVNDLDVRITKNSTEYKPWVMTPNMTSNNFTAAANKGDNFRDNVERIDISSLSEGSYTVKVTHKGTLLNEAQDFSMVIRGLPGKILSLNDTRIISLISVYPNPSKDGLLNISIPNQFKFMKFKIQLFDALGIIRKSKVYYEEQSMLDVSDLNSGVYYIKIELHNTIYTKVIIIDR